MAAFNCLPYINNNPQGLVNANMTHNFSQINTSIPPPNFQPAISMQRVPPPINACFTPPGSQHVIVPGSFLQNSTTNPPQFNSVPNNFLHSPPPPITPTFVPNTQMATQWNNRTFENNGHHVNPSFPSAPNNPGSNMHLQTASQIVNHQVPPPQWNHGVNFNGTINQPSTNNHFPSPTFNHQNLRNSEHLSNHNHVKNSVTPWLTFKKDNVPKTEFHQINHLNSCSFSNEQSRPSVKLESNWDPRQLPTTSVPDSNIFQDPSALLSISQNSIDKKNPSYSNKFDNGYFSNGVNSNASIKSFTSAKNSNQFVNQRNNDNKKRKNSFIDLGSSPKKFNYDKINGNFNDFSSFHNNKNHNKFNNDHIKYNWNNIHNQKSFIPMKSDHVTNFRDKSSQPINSNLIDVQVVSSDESNYGTEIKVEPSETFKNPSKRKSWNSDVASVSESESIEYVSSSNFSKDMYHHKNNFRNKAWNKEESASKNAWMTENIKLALQQRNALFMKAKNSQDPELWNEYNALKNKINEDIRAAKTNGRNSFKRVNSNFQRSFKKEYKQKEKDLPFNCDMCDRGFSTELEYQEHCALHIKCDYAGCNFEAHPKVVALHQKMQHDTGYADVINKLQNDEEIKKWREERKKRFPTAENILKRKAAIDEKKERGEVVETKDFGQFNKRKFNENKSQPKQHRRRQRNRTRQPRNYNSGWVETISDSEEEEDIHIKLPRFKGMNEKYEATVNEKVPDKDVSHEKTPILIESVTKEAGPLNIEEADQFPNNQNSDDEAPAELPISREPLHQHESDDQQDSKNSDDDAQPEISISKVPLDINSPQCQKNEVIDKNDLSSIKPTCDEIPSISTRNTSNQKRMHDSSENSTENKDKNNFKRRRNDITDPPRRSISLLEMLLDEDIRRERNMIMQSIRYIVRNNFFDVGTDKKSD